MTAGICGWLNGLMVETYYGGKTAILTYGRVFLDTRIARFCCKWMFLWKENKMQFNYHPALSWRQGISPLPCINTETRCAVGFELCIYAVLIAAVFKLGWLGSSVETSP